MASSMTYTSTFIQSHLTGRCDDVLEDKVDLGGLIRRGAPSWEGAVRTNQSVNINHAEERTERGHHSSPGPDHDPGHEAYTYSHIVIHTFVPSPLCVRAPGHEGGGEL